MKFFIDTANLDQIRQANTLGILDGVTTNPSLISQEGIIGEKNLHQHYINICNLIPGGDVSAEVIATDYAGMLSEGLDLANLHSQIVVKIPMTIEGLRIMQFFSKKGLRTNCTLIFSLSQAILAAKVGATYVSPFIGRLDDIASNGMTLLKDIRAVYNYYNFKTKILAASIRHSMHIVDCAKIGVNVITAPLEVIQNLLYHPMTDLGLKKFLDDFKQVSS